LGIVKSLLSSNEYGIESVTLDGKKVKSKGEKYIADYFIRNSINYEYEKPARTHALIFKEKISKPDFYLPDYDVYVEYWGLVDVEKRKLNREYERTMKWKMAMYYKNKIKFISLYPSNLENLDWIFRKKLKDICGVVIQPIGLVPPHGRSQKLTVAESKLRESTRNFCSKCGNSVEPSHSFCQRCGGKL
jgi:hypothetical protein